MYHLHINLTLKIYVFEDLENDVFQETERPTDERIWEPEQLYKKLKWRNMI